MAVKLVERLRVKDFLELPRADLQKDYALEQLIERASAEVERVCRRSFSRGTRETLIEWPRAPSYGSPNPIYKFLDLPVVEAEDFVVEGVAFTAPTGEGLVQLQPTAYSINYLTGVVTISPNIVYNQAIIGWPIQITHMRVKYTAGYEVTERPMNEDEDPLDDYGVTSVPDGLKHVVTQLVADSYRNNRGVFISERYQRLLAPWKKRDILF